MSAFTNKLVPSKNVVLSELDENLIRLYMQNNVGTFTVQTYAGETLEFYFVKNDPFASNNDPGPELLAMSGTRSAGTRSTPEGNPPTFNDYIDHMQDFLPEPRRLLVANGGDIILDGYASGTAIAYSGDTIEDGGVYQVTYDTPER